MVKVVMFDLDYTIVEYPTDLGWYNNTLISLLQEIGVGKHFTRKELYDLQFGESGLVLLNSLGISPGDFWSKFGERDFEVRRKLIRDCVAKPYDDVVALEGLKQSYRLGLVTDTPLRITNLELECFGLSKLFNVVVTASYIGGKPNPRTIVECLSLFGVQPSEAIMIGDSPQDLEAGRRAGTYTGFIIRPHNCNSAYSMQANLTLKSLSDVKSKIKCLEV